jgi:hypothetical protein
MEALYLIAAALVSRLSQHFSGKSPVAGEEPFQVRSLLASLVQKYKF